MQELMKVSKNEIELLESGISPGLFPYSGFLFSDGANIVFSEGGPRTMPGWEELVSINKDIQQIGQAFQQSTQLQRVYMGTPSELIAWDSTNGLITLRSIYTSGNWTFTNWGEWLIATNGVEPMQVWKGDPLVNAIDIVTPFATAKIVKNLRTHLLAFYSGEPNGSATVYWSASDNIDEWDPLIDPTAGNLFIRDLESEIKAVEYIGDRIAIYSADSMVLLTWLGFPLGFGVEKVLASIGAWGINSVTQVGRRNFGWGSGGIWVTDGVSSEYIDEPAIKAFLHDDLNLDAVDKIVCFHDESSQQVIWYYPSGSAIENDAGIGFDLKRNSWTKYSFGRSAAISRSIFDYPLTANTNVFLQGKGITAGSSDLVSSVQTKPVDFGAEGLYKRIQEVILLLDIDSGTVNLEVGSQENLEDVIDWFYSESAFIENFIPDRSSRFLSLRLTSTGAKWRLSGFSFKGIPEGFSV